MNLPPWSYVWQSALTLACGVATWLLALHAETFCNEDLRSLGKAPTLGFAGMPTLLLCFVPLGMVLSLRESKLARWAWVFLAVLLLAAAISDIPKNDIGYSPCRQYFFAPPGSTSMLMVYFLAPLLVPLTFVIVGLGTAWRYLTDSAHHARIHAEWRIGSPLPVVKVIVFLASCASLTYVLLRFVFHVHLR